MEAEESLRRFYSHRGEFFILIRANGIIVIEADEDDGSKESTLRIFMNSTDAIRYKDMSEYAATTRVQRTTLVGLWSLLGRINDLSMQQYNLPVKVDVSSFTNNGSIETVDTLHSAFALHC